MTNSRIQTIENQILELARKDAELYPINMPAEQISQHYSPALGNWARATIKLWQGETAWGFSPREPGSKFNLIKYIRDQGAFEYELTSPDTQAKLNELVAEWNQENPLLLAQLQAKDKEITELTVAKETIQAAYTSIFEEVQALRGLPRELSQTHAQLEQSRTKITQLENEVQTHLQALATAQEWHERQKAELQELNTKLQQDNRDLLNDMARAKQAKSALEQENNSLKQSLQTLQKQIKALTLLAKERKTQLSQEKTALIQLAQKKITNQKQAKELLNQLTEDWEQAKGELIEELGQQKERLGQHVRQTKSQLNQVIALIKEVLHG